MQSQNHLRRRVVVTGVGAVTPLGSSADQLWDGWMAGRSGIRRITQFDPTPFSCQIAGVAEPAGATSYTGLVKARQLGLITPDDLVLVISTGSGLKDVKAAMQAVPQAPVIDPTLESLKRVIES